MHQYVERLVDLTDHAANHIYRVNEATARESLIRDGAAAVRKLSGSFALVGRNGKTVRLARSLDRPLRYFLAKRTEGPALIVAERIDQIREWLAAEGLIDQFQPSYTRMVPAHHVVEIQLVGCPDPDPHYARFFMPGENPLPEDLDEIGRAYIGAAANEIATWLQQVPEHEPIGVCFSGGIDSGAVFLLVHHVMLRLGLSPARLKAFTLSIGGGQDLDQARTFLDRLGLGMFLEAIEAAPSDLNPDEAVRVVEDYKPLDVECAAVGLVLCEGIRRRYPEWQWLVDGDGGDENLKDYPIEENAELTIRSVINNPMLYQEGWGVGKIKHSLTYSGGLSRGCTRTFAPAQRYRFRGFHPFMSPAVIEVAEAIPFAALTNYEVDRLYGLKGDIVSRGVRAITGQNMPVFPKRRFQDGATPAAFGGEPLATRELRYRKTFLSQFA
jgi:asparagine synthase (glutamine-hydrolysing)